MWPRCHTNDIGATQTVSVSVYLSDLVCEAVMCNQFFQVLGYIATHILKRKQKLVSGRSLFRHQPLDRGDGGNIEGNGS